MDPLSIGVSAGLSLLSGFGAQKSAKKQAKAQLANDRAANEWNYNETERNNERKEALARELLDVEENVTTADSVDIDAMMAASRRAGFNPVTFLQNGGLAAYGRRSTTSTGHNAAAAYQMMMPSVSLVNATQATKIPSALEIIGDAGQAALKQYNVLDARESNENLQYNLLGMKLDAAQKAMYSRGGSLGNVPSYGTSGSSRSAGNGGALSIGDGSTPVTKEDSAKQTPFVPWAPWSDYSTNPEVRWFRTSNGGFAPGMGEFAKEANEEDLVATLAWNTRNRFMPSIANVLGSPPPVASLPGGYDYWNYSVMNQAWYPARRAESSTNITKVPDGTPNSLYINGYKIWPW